MSTSAIKKSSWSRLWFYIAAFWTVFAIIYEHFSHNVYSLYMILMPLIPFSAGIFSLICSRHKTTPSRFFQDGILSLTLSFVIKGVLEIYGTASVYADIFLYASLILLIAGILTTFVPGRHA